ncbi:hypothetical protein HYH03_004953 [Edaphochlamys debaryana]|uniref:Uncharacterized protein n=1 Tax=Edaphochlamys debaryana TaxID=47281 RepID=A0A836C2M0_9CHLO|nr:hypothetical protein HYH03_004953 [Edaphochlamys debaryana]|eukprot:KAG2496947.1 hypothetical protein HYH03_004953 [Edaphochlamys debaryana]
MCSDSLFGGCELNSGWVTTVAAPTTDTGKLIAYEQAATYKCESIKTEAECTKNSICEWFLGCSSSSTLLDPTWLRDKEFCSGSPIDKLVTCGINLKQSGCTGDCSWKTKAQITDATKNADVGGSDSNLPQTKAKLIDYLSKYMEWDQSYGDIDQYGGLCTPNWMWGQQLDDLANKAFKAEDFDSNIDEPAEEIEDDLIGTCAALTSYNERDGKCFDDNDTEADCNKMTGCAWDSFWDWCGAANPLYDTNDDYYKKFTAAQQKCSSLSSNCASAGTIAADVTKTDALTATKPTPTSGGSGGGGSGSGSPGAAGMASMSSLLMALGSALALVLAVL